MGEDERGPHRAPEAPFLRDTVCCGYMDAMCARRTVLEVDPNVAPPKNREASCNWSCVVDTSISSVLEPRSQ